MLLKESLLYSHIPSSSTFGEEKTKQRSSGPVLVAVLPEAQMRYFDVKDKAWRPLESLASETDRSVTLWEQCFCTETVGKKLFIAGWDPEDDQCIYCYDMKFKVWEEHQHPSKNIDDLSVCIVENYMYTNCSDYDRIPQRYWFAERQWQSCARVNITCDSDGSYHPSGVTKFHSKVYALYGPVSESNCMHNAVLHCFDPVRNAWEQKESTCQPHFGSSLFVVNSKLYVAGGNVSLDDDDKPCGLPAAVEVYDEENNRWSIVE